MINTQKVFQEFETSLMQDDKPSIYFNRILKTELASGVYPFTLLGSLVSLMQSPRHHPEGSVWNHTMLVVDNAAQRRQLSKDPQTLMWSALLHDIGKAPATKVRNGRITSYDHDRIGKKLAEEFLRCFTDDSSLISKVSRMVRWHMQALFVVKGLPFADIGKMMSEVPLSEIALLCLCDRLGRGGMTEEKVKEERENINNFITRCREYLRRNNQYTKI